MWPLFTLSTRLHGQPAALIKCGQLIESDDE
ncbi:MAG: hypothetical protein ACI95X_003120 [Paraglaciecola sp.]